MKPHSFLVAFVSSLVLSLPVSLTDTNNDLLAFELLPQSLDTPFDDFTLGRTLEFQ